MNDKKRVALTVYVSSELADKLTRGYAMEVLNGYNGTKQSYLSQLFESALSVREGAKYGRDI